MTPWTRTSRPAAEPPDRRASRAARRSGRVGAVAAGIALVSALLVGSEARSARRRYATAQLVTVPVDLMVWPSRSVETSTTPVELAALGDSGMAGVGVREPGDTLPVLLARRVADALGRPVHVVGYGQPGARTADVRAEQAPLIRGPVDACVVMVGTNDVIRATSWARLARETDGLLDGLTALGAPVVLSSLPEFRAMTAVPWTLRSLVLLAAAVARVVQWRAARPGGRRARRRARGRWGPLRPGAGDDERRRVPPLGNRLRPDRRCAGSHPGAGSEAPARGACCMRAKALRKGGGPRVPAAARPGPARVDHCV